MTSLRHLKEIHLIENTKSLVREERRIGIEILRHLREYERRSLYLRLGFSSLFDYVVRDLGYAEASAYRRISAMRALVDLPELEEKLSNGSLSVTQIAQVQSFVREEKNERKVLYSKEKKRELFLAVAGKSKRETEMHFRSIAPDRTRPESVREIDGRSVEVRFEMDPQLRAQIEEIQVRASYALQGSTKMRDTVYYMSEYTLRDLRKQRDASFHLTEQVETVSEAPQTAHSPPAATTATAAATTAAIAKPTTPVDPFEDLNTVRVFPAASSRTQQNSRFIPIDLKRRVFERAEHRCEYRSGEGKRCEEIRFLEIDHVRPYSKGGSSRDSNNLQILCRAHNQWRAITMGLSRPETKNPTSPSNDPAVPG